MNLTVSNIMGKCMCFGVTFLQYKLKHIERCFSGMWVVSVESAVQRCSEYLEEEKTRSWVRFQ